MEEEMMQTEATAATETGGTANETASGMNEQQETEFLTAFDGDGDEKAKEDGEPEEAENPKENILQKESGEKLNVGGREYTPADVEGLLRRVTELQGAVNTPPPERALIERLATQMGMDAESFMLDAENTLNEGRIMMRMDQLLSQGLDEEMARHVAELEVKNKTAENARMEEQGTENPEEEANRKMHENIREFANVYPDVKKLPDEVYEEIQKTGANPLAAYQRYVIAQKDKELAALRQDRKNREQSTGSVKGRTPMAEDPFVAELMK